MELPTYALFAFPVYFKRVVVDAIDQLALQAIRVVVPQRLLNGIAKPLPRLDLVGSSISAFQVDTLVLCKLFGVAVTVDIALGVAGAEKSASTSNHC